MQAIDQGEAVRDRIGDIIEADRPESKIIVPSFGPHESLGFVSSIYEKIDKPDRDYYSTLAAALDRSEPYQRHIDHYRAFTAAYRAYLAVEDLPVDNRCHADRDKWSALYRAGVKLYLMGGKVSVDPLGYTFFPGREKRNLNAAYRLGAAWFSIPMHMEE